MSAPVSRPSKAVAQAGMRPRSATTGITAAVTTQGRLANARPRAAGVSAAAVSPQPARPAMPHPGPQVGPSADHSQISPANPGRSWIRPTPPNWSANPTAAYPAAARPNAAKKLMAACRARSRGSPLAAISA